MYGLVITVVIATAVGPIIQLVPLAPTFQLLLALPIRAHTRIRVSPP